MSLNTLVAQNGLTDKDSKFHELQKEIKEAKSNKTKADLMVELGYKQFKTDSVQGKKTILEAYQLYRNGDVLNRSNALGRMARAYRKHGDTKHSGYYYFLAAREVKNHSEYDSLEAYYYMAGGREFYETAMYDSAMYYYMKAKDIYESGKIFNQHHGYLHHYIGSVHKRLGDKDLAKKWYQLEEQYGIDHGMLNIQAEATYLQAELSPTVEGQAAYNEKAVELYSKLGDDMLLALVKSNLAMNYISMEKFNEAETLINEAITEFEKYDDPKMLCTPYCTKAKLYTRTGKYDLAQKELIKAESMALKMDAKRYLQLKRVYEQFYELDRARRDYESALGHFELYKAYEDSSEQAEFRAEVKEMDVRYQTAQKELQIANQNREIEKQNAIQEQEAITKRYLIIGLTITLLLSLLIFNRLSVTRKQKRIIEDQKREVELKNKEITDSMVYAKRIQTAILPQVKVIKECFDQSFILYLPKDIVAGDFYWMEQSEGMVLFAVADCTGHGVPGAMVSVICNGGLNRSVREFGLKDPGEILDKTREIVLSEFEKSEDEVNDGMDIALCSLTENKLKYAGAHNPLWIIRKGANDIEEIKADKQPIGRSSDAKPYTSHELELEEGDSIYIFSDGFADQFGGEQNKKYMTAQFRKFLLSIKDYPMQKQMVLLEQEFNAWKGRVEQLDDVCVMGVRYC